jgi:hypothetical protein
LKKIQIIFKGGGPSIEFLFEDDNVNLIKKTKKLYLLIIIFILSCKYNKMIFSKHFNKEQKIKERYFTPLIKNREKLISYLWFISNKIMNYIMHSINGNTIYLTSIGVVKCDGWKDIEYCKTCNSWHSKFDYYTTSLNTAKNSVKICCLAINKGYIPLYLDNKTKIHLYNLLPLNIMVKILDYCSITYEIHDEYLPYYKGDFNIKRIHPLVSFNNVTFNSCGTQWTKSGKQILTLPNIQLSFNMTREYKGLYFNLKDNISNQMCVFCDHPTYKYGMYKSNSALYMLIELPNLIDGYNNRNQTQMLDIELSKYIPTTYPVHIKSQFDYKSYDSRYAACTKSGFPSILQSSIVNIDYNPKWGKLNKYKRLYRINKSYYTEKLLSKYIKDIIWYDVEYEGDIDIIVLKNCIIEAMFFNHVNTFYDLSNNPYGLYEEVGLKDDIFYGRINLNHNVMK